MFHRRFTLGAKCGVVLFAALSLYFLWEKMPIAGLLLVIFVVLMIERVLHSAYKFQDDKLIIYRGRFAKTRVIKLREITRCTPMKTMMGLSRYLLIEHGLGRLESVQPENETLFLQELTRRQKQHDR